MSKKHLALRGETAFTLKNKRLLFLSASTILYNKYSTQLHPGLVILSV